MMICGFQINGMRVLSSWQFFYKFESAEIISVCGNLQCNSDLKGKNTKKKEVSNES